MPGPVPGAGPQSSGPWERRPGAHLPARTSPRGLRRRGALRARVRGLARRGERVWREARVGAGGAGTATSPRSLCDVPVARAPEQVHLGSWWLVIELVVEPKYGT